MFASLCWTHQFDGVVAAQTAVRTGAHVNIARQTVAAVVQVRRVPHVEVHDPQHRGLDALLRIYKHNTQFQSVCHLVFTQNLLHL